LTALFPYSEVSVAAKSFLKLIFVFIGTIRTSIRLLFITLCAVLPNKIFSKEVNPLLPITIRSHPSF